MIDAYAVLILGGDIGTAEDLKVRALIDPISHAGQDLRINLEAGGTGHHLQFSIDALAVLDLRGSEGALVPIVVHARVGLHRLNAPHAPGVGHTAVAVENESLVALHHQRIQRIGRVIDADVEVPIVGRPSTHLSRPTAGELLLDALLTLPWQDTSARECGVARSVGAEVRSVHTLIAALVVPPTVVRIREQARLLTAEGTSLGHLALRLEGASEGTLVAAIEIVLRLAAQHRNRFPAAGGIADAVAQGGAVHANEAGNAHILAGIIIGPRRSDRHSEQE